MSTHRIVNVASVPKRSPFRYPGGKTWLVPTARKWIRHLESKPSLFIEPFVGGGIIALTIICEDLAEHAILVERDPEIAAVWKTILSSKYKTLSSRILEFNVTEENVREELSGKSTSLADIAFRTILRNRMQHGGIIAPGASLIKSGENGKGLKSRWYPKTLADRINVIGDIRDRFTFLEGDGIDTINTYSKTKNVAFFIDPPYTAAGKKAGARLYKFFELDHSRLFEVAAEIQGDFLMTYDNAEGVRNLAAKHSLDTELIPMKNTHHAQMTELLIGKDLSWARLHGNSDNQVLLAFD